MTTPSDEQIILDAARRMAARPVATPESLPTSRMSEAIAWLLLVADEIGDPQGGAITIEPDEVTI